MIAVFGALVFQLITIPRLSNQAEISKMRLSLAEKYEQRANQLSDSAFIMANQIKIIRGNLTDDQEKRINRLLARAKELKDYAERMKSQTIKDAEANSLLHSCHAIYGEINTICRQLQTEATQKSK